MIELFYIDSIALLQSDSIVLSFWNERKRVIESIYNIYHNARKACIALSASENSRAKSAIHEKRRFSFHYTITRIKSL